MVQNLLLAYDNFFAAALFFNKLSDEWCITDGSVIFFRFMDLRKDLSVPVKISHASYRLEKGSRTFRRMTFRRRTFHRKIFRPMSQCQLNV